MKKIQSELLYSVFIFCFSLAGAQPTRFQAHGIGGGGGFFSPGVNPVNSNEIFMVTDMTDLFHSLDGGNSWSVISFTSFVANPSLSPTIQFTNQSNTLYSTSSNWVTELSLAVKSTDGGNTWNPIPTDPTSGNGVWFTIANPQNSDQLIVADYGDLYFSGDGGNTFINNGTPFYTDSSGNGAYIAGCFFDGANIYVCTQRGILVSVNSGQSWSGPVEPGITDEDIVSFAGAKSGGITRFFCITESQGSVYVGTNGFNSPSYANVYSMDYGGSFVVKNTGILSGDWPFFIGMTANNINIAYIGGSSGNSGYPIVLKTSDAGGVWNYIFNTTNNQNIQTGYCGYEGDFGYGFSQWALGFTVSLNDSNTVVLTDQGFAHKTNNGGYTWQDVYVPASYLNPAGAPTPRGLYYGTSGLENTSCWELMWYDSLHLFAGYSDIGAVRSQDGGNTWGFDCNGLTEGNTYKFLKNPSNGVIYAATSSVHDMYQSTYLEDGRIDGGTGSVMFSTDIGKTFQTMYNFGHPVIWLALDPTNANRMYAGVINHSGPGNPGGIWICNDIQNNASATWSHCADPPRTQGHPFNIRVLNDGTLIATYSGRRNSAGEFTDSSGVFVSTNQGASWSDVSDPGMEYWTMDIVIDPNDNTQNTWYVCVFSGWGGKANNLGGIYRTTNRGGKWTKIANTENNNIGGLSSVFSLTFDPVNMGAAYINSEGEGLWFSPDIEATSPVFNLVQSYPFEQPNRVYFNPYHNNQVWVNSFGNGIEMGTLTSSANGINNDQDGTVTGDGMLIYPNPNNGEFTVKINNPDNETVLLNIYDILGHNIFSTATNQQLIPCSLKYLQAGVYLVSVKGTNSTGVGRIILK